MTLLIEILAFSTQLFSNLGEVAQKISVLFYSSLLFENTLQKNLKAFNHLKIKPIMKFLLNFLSPLNG